jgi:predicted CXXCH cytochrome family protein
VKSLLVMAVLYVMTVGSVAAGSWTDNRCGTCHETDALFSHPVDIAPVLKVPAKFPLENGLMTCATCHQDEDSSQHAAARMNHSLLLRTSNTGRAFCAECHDLASTARASQHATFLGQAHLAWPAPKHAFTATAAKPLQDTTRSCLTCHDGNIATDVNMGRIGSFEGPNPADHPVAIPYQSTGGTALNPLSSLDLRIKVIDGQVGCVSCHSPYSRQKSLLVMSNIGSKLCLSCHRM